MASRRHLRDWVHGDLDARSIWGRSCRRISGHLPTLHPPSFEDTVPEPLRLNHVPYVVSIYIIYCILYIATKPEFGSCKTRVWQLPNSGLAAAKLRLAAAKPGFGSCQTRASQQHNDHNMNIAKPHPIAAARLWVGNCQTLVWQLLNSGLAAARRGTGSNRN